MARTVAIIGGIGSGKSMVCKALIAMGYEVYDCDSWAKRLMDTSEHIKRDLCRDIDPLVVVDGEIDRPHLASLVFSDDEKLRKMNSIVHYHVREHIKEWIRTRADQKLVFIETAILQESHLDELVDEAWWVDAPRELRIERVGKRNSLSVEEITRRMDAQRTDARTLKIPVRMIDNDGFTPILPQIERLINESINEN